LRLGEKREDYERFGWWISEELIETFWMLGTSVPVNCIRVCRFSS